MITYRDLLFLVLGLLIGIGINSLANALSPVSFVTLILTGSIAIGGSIVYGIALEKTTIPEMVIIK